ncbi:hypothetical protein M433DRAFT_143565 [Acidomyces richmondensis BFW]|nr:MAG: hypothetical protein FE78DRAFT_79520 [Acidomyces sp. 'richmondensis']KYG45854.1 hypothetical protein M433DRAFT_143565 [Acidomyces richmondensis BFW]
MRTESRRGLREVLENWDFTKGKRPHLTMLPRDKPPSSASSQTPPRHLQTLLRTRYPNRRRRSLLVPSIPISTTANTTTTCHGSNVSFNPVLGALESTLSMVSTLAFQWGRLSSRWDTEATAIDDRLAVF